MSVEVASSLQFPLEGPYWTEQEGAALLMALDEAFPDAEIPTGDRLVKDPRHSDAGPVLDACGGRMWRTIDAESLWRAQDFWAQCTDSGFVSLLPAYVRQAIAAGPDDRLKFEQLAITSLTLPSKSREELTRQLSLLTRQQVDVLGRFLFLALRSDSRSGWQDSDEGAFWQQLLGSVNRTGIPGGSIS